MTMEDKKKEDIKEQEELNKDIGEKEDAVIAKSSSGEEEDLANIMTEDGKNTMKELYDEAVKVLQSCYDPEIPVDIYALGLIYDIKLTINRDVLVVMTLTSPSCPVAGTLPGEIEEKLRSHPMINEAKIHLTFDPPWDMSMMTEEAKLELGML
jgi:FeS assembly SUF system protein